eukprot:7659961-Alexandrium_andersonii.AAC.1
MAASTITAAHTARHASAGSCRFPEVGGKSKENESQPASGRQHTHATADAVRPSSHVLLAPRPWAVARCQ